MSIPTGGSSETPSTFIVLPKDGKTHCTEIPSNQLPQDLDATLKKMASNAFKEKGTVVTERYKDNTYIFILSKEDPLTKGVKGIAVEMYESMNEKQERAAGSETGTPVTNPTSVQPEGRLAKGQNIKRTEFKFDRTDEEIQNNISNYLMTQVVTREPYKPGNGEILLQEKQEGDEYVAYVCTESDLNEVVNFFKGDYDFPESIAKMQYQNWINAVEE